MTSVAAPPDFDAVAAAARRILGHAHRTPVMTSATADAQVGARLFFKCENLQRTGAFKFRGAFNALANLDAAQRRAGVIAYSSGNHAQAIALAGRILGIPATIVMPRDAPANKLEATRGYGAEVVLYDRYSEDRDALGRSLAQQRGLALIPPFDHPDVIAGQGTCAMELIEEVGELDALITPLGGGGLLGGCAIAARRLSPQCELHGVEPEAGDDARQSLRAGHIVRIPVPQTIADGAQTQALGQLTYPILKREVTEVITVSDAELVDCMGFLMERMKLVVEPTGCLGFAGARRLGAKLAGRRVGIILSGGNIDARRFAQLVRAWSPAAAPAA
jgi:threonine dehydratase